MSSPYFLAVDIRADTTVAAIAEAPNGGAVRTSVAALHEGAAMPTVAFVAPEDLLFGGDAAEAGRHEPHLVIADFVDADGAAGSITIDGQQFARADLYAWMVGAVVGQVTADRDAAPAGVWVVAPVSWSDTAIDEIADALDRDGQSDVDFISVPEALANRYCQLDPVDSADPPLTLLVCDVDEFALTAAVVTVAPGAVPRTIGAAVAATAAASDLERDAVDSIARELDRLGIAVDDLDAIYLAGSSAHVPLVERLLVEEFGDPIAMDADASAAAALGAAFALAREALPAASSSGTVLAAAAAAAAAAAPTAAVATPTPPQQQQPVGRPWFRRPAGLLSIGVAAAAVIAAAGVGAVFAFGGAAQKDVSSTDGLSDGSTAQRALDGNPSSSPTPSPSPSPSTTAPGDVPNPFETTEPVNPRIPLPAPQQTVTPVAPAPPAAAPSAPMAPAAPSGPPASDPVPTTVPGPVPSAEPTAEPTVVPSPLPSTGAPVVPTPDPPVVPAPAPEPSPSTTESESALLAP